MSWLQGRRLKIWMNTGWKHLWFDETLISNSDQFLANHIKHLWCPAPREPLYLPKTTRDKFIHTKMRERESILDDLG